MTDNLSSTFSATQTDTCGGAAHAHRASDQEEGALFIQEETAASGAELSFASHQMQMCEADLTAAQSEMAAAQTSLKGQFALAQAPLRQRRTNSRLLKGLFERVGDEMTGWDKLRQAANQFKRQAQARFAFVVQRVSNRAAALKNAVANFIDVRNNAPAPTRGPKNELIIGSD